MHHGGHGQNLRGAIAEAARKMPFGVQSMTRQDASPVGEGAGVITLRLGEDGYLYQQGTDARVKVPAFSTDRAASAVLTQRSDRQGTCLSSYHALFLEKSQSSAPVFGA